ncbi:hypothetical protein [Nocardia wallacei]|uniref:hypothetical protein n=1 Tax=Nocardia wallacei TaxID=480035 RepID=UPI0024588BFA|nr:hypothetical protein [Nocardia wallacei]
MADPLIDRDVEAITAVAALVNSGDLRRAKQQVRELAKTFDRERLGMIWQCVSIWERHPYEEAKAEMRQLWHNNPTQRALIEKLVPPTDPHVHKAPGNPLPARPAGGRNVRANATNSNGSEFYRPPRNTRRRVDPALRTGPTRPSNREEHNVVDAYFGDTAADQRTHAAAQRRRQRTGEETIDDTELLDEAPDGRAGVDDNKPFTRDSRKPFASLDIQHDSGYDDDRYKEVEDYYRDQDKADATPPLRGLPCVACRLERATLDSSTSPYGLPYNERIRSGRGDDGLCNPCRTDGMTGIRELPLGHSKIDAINARCEFIAEHNGPAARSILRQEWHQCRDMGDIGYRAIESWVRNHPELPQTPKQQTPHSISKVATEPVAASNGWCEGCSEYRQVTDGQCVDCRPASTAPPSRLLKKGEVRSRSERTERTQQPAAVVSGEQRRQRVWRSQSSARQAVRRRHL